MPSPLPNFLPFEGEVFYHGPVMTTAEADAYFQRLLDGIEWKHDEAVIMGKHIVTKRKVAWYADEPFEYRYSRRTKTALPWTGDLPQLKALTEKLTGERYNSCLLNLYHSGEEGMAWHSDDEKELKPGSAIASLTFGAERRFGFRHRKSGETIYLPLANGSLLVMRGATQRNWTHRLPIAKKVKEARINLTFRVMERPGLAARS